MPPQQLKELLTPAIDAVKRLTNQTLLFAVILFSIAIAATLILLTEATTPWWVRTAVSLLLCIFVCSLAYVVVVQRNKVQGKGATPSTTPLDLNRV